MKNKRKKFILILFIILIMSLGFTYAFFAYNRVSDSSNTLVAGDIYMNLVDVSNSITLTNQYPMTPEEARSRNDNYIDFNITGKNTSSDSIYYEIGLDYADDIDGKIRMHDGDLSFDLIDLSNNSYLIKEVSFGDFKKAILYTSSIGTTDSYSRSFRLRMWINDSVIISDTEPNAHYRASSNGDTDSIVYSDTFANVKVKVYGDMVEKSSLTNLYDTLNNSAVMDNIRSTYVSNSTGIDYTTSGGFSNGMGLYKLSSTSDDDYPINFFRGKIENNNIIFANKCWQIVRTTETGGTKIIYNGEPSNYKYTLLHDLSTTYMGGSTSVSINKTITAPYTGFFWIVLKVVGQVSNIKLHAGSSYTSNELNFSTTEGITYRSILWDSTDGDSGLITTLSGTLGVNASITFNLYRMDTGDTLSCRPTYEDNYIDVTNLKGVNNYPASRTLSNGTSRNAYYINNGYYMYNKVEKGYVEDTVVSNARYATQLYYDSNSHLYTQPEGVSSPSVTNKFFINPTTSSNVNGNVVIYHSGSTTYYVVLNGDSDFNAYLTNISKNVNNSYAKKNVDDWFNSHMYKYADMLEDTVFCNDRSMEFVGSNNFDIVSHTQKNISDGIIDLSCPNANDRFTVSKNNGNGDLSVPVGLIDAYEANLAGVNGDNSDSYLSSSNFIITMTNSYLNGRSYFFYNGTRSAGITRPVVSLKHDTLIYGGDGSINNPYVVR